MTFEEFLDIVAQMREQQQKFFSSVPGSRDRIDSLRESRRLEKYVDKIINATKAAQQTKLF